MAHPKLFPAMLASLQMNQMMIGEAFEEIAALFEKEGATETAQKLRVRVDDLRFNAKIMDWRLSKYSRRMRTCTDPRRP